MMTVGVTILGVMTVAETTVTVCVGGIDVIVIVGMIIVGVTTLAVTI